MFLVMMDNVRSSLPLYHLGETPNEKREDHDRDQQPSHHYIKPLPLRLPLNPQSHAIPPPLPLKSGRLKINTAIMPVVSLDDYSSGYPPGGYSPWFSNPRWDLPTMSKQLTAFFLTLILLMAAYPYQTGFLPLIAPALVYGNLSAATKSLDWFLFNLSLFYTSYCLFSLASLFDSDTVLVWLPLAGCFPGGRTSRTILGGQLVTESRKKWWSGWMWTWHPRYFWYLASVEAVFLAVVGIVSDRGDIDFVRKWSVLGVILVTGYIGWAAARVMTVRWWTWY